MALTEQELTFAYRGLLNAFPEDLHIARPMIQMLQDRGDNESARELSMDMARRMLALGYSTYALAFITICEKLKHPDTDEIESIKTMAELTLSATHQDDDVKMFELIETLSDVEAKDFLLKGTLLTVKEGESIVKQGEISRKFYLILNGIMRVHVLTRGDEDITLTNLQKGEFFGEFACVYHLPRTATVTASSEVTVLEFDDEVITDLVEASPEAGDSLMGTVRRRMIASVSYSHPIFAKIQKEDSKWLGDEAVLIEYGKGDSMIEDSEGRFFYILAYGHALVSFGTYECKLDVNALYGQNNKTLRLPEGSQLVATERCLICKIPLDIFDAFSKAYEGFEAWAEAHALERNRKLGLL